MEAAPSLPRPAPLEYARRIDWSAVSTWLLGFGLIAYLGLKGGGFDPLVHDQVGIAIWWIVLAGVLVGALPRRRLGPLAWCALGLLAAFVAWTALGIVASAVKLGLSAGRPGAGGGDFVECPPLCFQILEYGMNCRYPQFHVEVAGHRRAVEAGRAAAGLDL